MAESVSVAHRTRRRRRSSSRHGAEHADLGGAPHRLERCKTCFAFRRPLWTDFRGEELLNLCTWCYACTRLLPSLPSSPDGERAPRRPRHDAPLPSADQAHAPSAACASPDVIEHASDTPILDALVTRVVELNEARFADQPASPVDHASDVDLFRRLGARSQPVLDGLLSRDSEWLLSFWTDQLASGRSYPFSSYHDSTSAVLLHSLHLSQPMLQSALAAPASILYSTRLQAMRDMAASESPHDEFILLSRSDEDAWYSHNMVPGINMADPAVRNIAELFDRRPRRFPSLLESLRRPFDTGMENDDDDFTAPRDFDEMLVDRLELD